MRLSLVALAGLAVVGCRLPIPFCALKDDPHPIPMAGSQDAKPEPKKFIAIKDAEVLEVRLCAKHTFKDLDKGNWKVTVEEAGEVVVTVRGTMNELRHGVEKGATITRVGGQLIIETP